MLDQTVLNDRFADPSFVAPGWSARPEAWERKRHQALNVLKLFSDRFGRQNPRETLLGFVPGRVEVLGKHTDYAGGHSLLLTLDRGFVFAAATNPSGRVRMCNTSSEFNPVDFPVSTELAPTTGE